MSTSNPFEKLNIKHDDEEDEQGGFEKVKGKERNAPYGIEIKKRKVRPKEKVEEGNDEGFEEVKNKVSKKRPYNYDDEEGQGNEHKKRRGINYEKGEQRDYKDNKRPARGRKYDRQSGTGRGREVAKDGAGGNYTWGDNSERIAKDFENNYDDYYFEEALNPENKERYPRRQRRDNKNEGEEGKEEGEHKENGKEEKENKKFDEKKKIELRKEDKLEIPKNAIFLGQYLDKLEKPKEEEKKDIKRIKDGKPLSKKVDKSNEDIVGTTGAGKKKEKKKKEKEIKKEEEILNAEIGANLRIGEDFDRPRRGRGGRGRGGRGRERRRGGRREEDERNEKEEGEKEKDKEEEKEKEEENKEEEKEGEEEERKENGGRRSGRGRDGRGRGRGRRGRGGRNEEKKQNKFVFNEDDFPKIGE